DQREIGHRAPVRQAPAPQIRHFFAPQPLTQLEDQPRLADPGLAHDPDHLPVATRHRGEPAQQELEVLVTPDKAGQPLAEAEPAPFLAQAVHPARRAARRGASSTGSSPNAAMTPAGLSSST